MLQHIHFSMRVFVRCSLCVAFASTRHTREADMSIHPMFGFFCVHIYLLTPWMACGKPCHALPFSPCRDRLPIYLSREGRRVLTVSGVVAAS